MFPTTEPEITFLLDSVGPRAEGTLPEGSAAAEVEVDVPSASPEVLAPVTGKIEPSMSVSDSSIEPTQPTFLLAVTQGTRRPKRFFLLFMYNPSILIIWNLFLMVLYRSCISC